MGSAAWGLGDTMHMGPYSGEGSVDPDGCRAQTQQAPSWLCRRPAGWPSLPETGEAEDALPGVPSEPGVSGTWGLQAHAWGSRQVRGSVLQPAIRLTHELTLETEDKLDAPWPKAPPELLCGCWTPPLHTMSRLLRHSAAPAQGDLLFDCHRMCQVQKLSQEQLQALDMYSQKQHFQLDTLLSMQ